MSYLPTPNRLSARMHVVETAWRLQNPALVAIGPQPRLVLALRARRDVELLTLRVDYPEMGEADKACTACEAVLVQVPHAVGLRRIKPDGEPWVYGQESVDATPMLGGKPEDRAVGAEHVRWWGDVIEMVEYNRNLAPNVWWAWRGRVAIPKWASVGVIVRADVATCARVMLAGV